MVERVRNKQSAGHFPADLFSLLLLPAVLIAFAALDFRYSRLVLLLLGTSELWIGASILKQRPSSPIGWLTLTVGFVIIAAAAYMFFTPMRLRTT